MRLQLLFLTVTVLFERPAAYAIQNETAGESLVKESETDTVTDKPINIEPKLESLQQNNNIRLMPLAFRPNSNMPLSIMGPEPNVLGPITLKRLSMVPLRGFFSFRNQQLGSVQVRQNELGNFSEPNCTNCPARYLPRQIAKRTASKVPRTRMPYDVPQIECPQARDGSERFSCPSPDITNRYKCIEDRALCDGFIDCPNAEDEDMRACMFYKTTKAHLDVLADALLRWARGRY